MARPIGEPRDAPAVLGPPPDPHRLLHSPSPTAKLRPGGLRQWIGPAVLVALALLALIPVAGIGGGRPTAAGSRSPVALATRPPATTAPTPTDRTPSATTRIPAVRTSATPAPTAPATKPATPAPTAAPTAPPAPTPAATPEFDRRQVIDMAFPLPAGTRYRYRNNYGEPRPGSIQAYNHVYGMRDGKLRRAHDGIDLYAARGTPVLAPFKGRVIDPVERWSGWLPERYGICVVIVSRESASRGYAALLCHLDERTVRVGARVTRGKEIGTVGASGNAENAHAQLHFELRAPFPIAWQEAGGTRLVDAFNPYRSLRAADPALAN